MDNAPACERRRQELKEEAYYLVLKALILRDKPDMTLLAKLRLELSIGTDVHKQWMTELLRAKNAGTLAIHVDDRPGFKQQAITTMPSVGNARAGAWQQGQQTASQQQQFAQQQQQQEIAARAKPKAEELRPDGLPADPLFLKVQFYRTSDGWLEGVITDHSPATRKIKVNVLQTKKVEWLDYVPSPCLIVHVNAKVTDLSQYV